LKAKHIFVILLFKDQAYIQLVGKTAS